MKVILSGSFKCPQTERIIEGMVDMTRFFLMGGLDFCARIVENQKLHGYLPPGEAWALSYADHGGPVEILAMYWGEDLKPEPEVEQMNMELTNEDQFKLYEMRRKARAAHLEELQATTKIDLIAHPYRQRQVCPDAECCFCGTVYCEDDTNTEESV